MRFVLVGNQESLGSTVCQCKPLDSVILFSAAPLHCGLKLRRA